MKNVITRSLSGIVYIALIVGATLGGGWWFMALMALFAIFGTIEMQNIVAHRTGSVSPWWIRGIDMAGMLLMLSVAPVAMTNAMMFDCWVIVAVLWLFIRLTAALAQHNGDVFAETAGSVFSIMYVGLPLALLGYFVLSFDNPAPAVLSMFILIWLNDTGAFCFGSTLGKHRLCERLSPKKSWEGFWGGFGVCLIAGGLLSAWMELPNFWYGIAYGAIVSVASTWGDLFESLIKRSAHVKDAGNIIPGHGGILDRIDSLLFVIPASAVFFAFLLLK